MVVVDRPEEEGEEEVEVEVEEEEEEARKVEEEEEEARKVEEEEVEEVGLRMKTLHKTPPLPTQAGPFLLLPAFELTPLTSGCTLLTVPTMALPSAPIIP
jgi:hypothetical protein